jgi:hypothetical protein
MRNRKIPLSFNRRFVGHNPGGTTLIIQDELFESVAVLAPDHLLDGEHSLEYLVQTRSDFLNPTTLLI